jgi:acetoacetate decarboxylase
MPIQSPSYPKGPYRFLDREYLNILYESDTEAIRAAVPEPLEPDGSGTVIYEFIKMPDSSGFGDYAESGLVIPCRFEGKPVNFTAQMYLNCHPPIAGGREIWGFPKKHAEPSLTTIHDTLTGKLIYADQLVALGTMAYNHQNMIGSEKDRQAILEKFSKTQVNLKIIPSVDGGHDVLQLISYEVTNVNLKSAWSSPARLHLVPHVNAPVADLPVRRVLGGTHFMTDLTLPFGRVIHDYLSE